MPILKSNMLEKMAKGAFNRVGLNVRRLSLPSNSDVYLDCGDLIDRVRPYTMTSPERIYALIQAVEYIVEARIPGSIVECGVWRGGSMMAAAWALINRGVRDRDLYLFDTYKGMVEPKEVDASDTGQVATEKFNAMQSGPNRSAWNYTSLEDVIGNLAQTSYPTERLHFVKGNVTETLHSVSTEQIALLRLDTNWYESTYAEMKSLFPHLTTGGVLLLDDYGHWQGAKKAVDQYLSETRTTLLLNRIDRDGRIAVKS